MAPHTTCTTHQCSRRRGTRVLAPKDTTSSLCPQHFCCCPRGVESIGCQTDEKSGGGVTAHPSRGHAQGHRTTATTHQGWEKEHEDKGAKPLSIIFGWRRETDKKTAHALGKININRESRRQPICCHRAFNPDAARAPETEQMPSAGPFVFFLALWEGTLVCGLWWCAWFLACFRPAQPTHALVEGLTRRANRFGLWTSNTSGTHQREVEGQLFCEGVFARVCVAC